MANTKKENKETVDLTTIKEELTDYINIQIKKNFTEEVEKANQRLIKEKNKKIFVRNIVILLLFFIIIFLLNILYNNHYFDKFFTQETNISETTNIKESTETSEEQYLDNIINKYSFLLDNVKISETSSYLNDYYNGNLTTELKLYLALNNLDIEDLETEEDYTIIKEDSLKTNYNNLFTDEYVGTSFKYNDIKIKYYEKLNSYISDELLSKETSNIKREIQDIKLTDDEIIITTIEAIVKDNKVYSIQSSQEITTYKDYSFTKYEDKLNTVTYTFKDNKLISIK